MKMRYVIFVFNTHTHTYMCTHSYSHKTLYLFIRQSEARKNLKIGKRLPKDEGCFKEVLV